MYLSTVTINVTSYVRICDSFCLDWEKITKKSLQNLEAAKDHLFKYIQTDVV